MPQPQILAAGNGLIVARLGGEPRFQGQSPLRDAMMADSPVALYKCGEASGASILVDEVGNAHPGTFVEPVMRGQTSLTSDPTTSLGFPGVGTVGYATVPFAAALAPATTWSIVAVMLDTILQTGTTALFDGRSGALQGMTLQIDTTNRPVLKIGNGASSGTLTGTALSLGVPHIIHATYDGTNARIYQDGVLTAGPTALVYTANTSAALRIGYDVNQAKGFAGYEGYVGIYSTLLSQARVTAHSAAFTGAVQDLNDGVNTSLQDWGSEDSNRQLVSQQLVYQSESAYTSDDFGPRTFSLPLVYIEDSTHFLGQLLANLSQMGEQNLTFDLLTQTLVKYAGANNRKLRRRVPSYWWDVNLEFTAKSPWFSDIALTAATPWAPIVTDAGQSVSITYPGSIFSKPVWILQIPASNAVAINSIQIQNQMSGESLTVDFVGSVGAIPATTARTIRIDTAAMTAVDNLGNYYNVSGSFPRLYGPPGQAQTVNVIVTPASGSTSGLQLGYEYSARWQL